MYNHSFRWSQVCMSSTSVQNRLCDLRIISMYYWCLHKHPYMRAKRHTCVRESVDNDPFNSVRAAWKTRTDMYWWSTKIMRERTPAAVSGLGNPHIKPGTIDTESVSVVLVFLVAGTAVVAGTKWRGAQHFVRLSFNGKGANKCQVFNIISSLNCDSELYSICLQMSVDRAAYSEHKTGV